MNLFEFIVKFLGLIPDEYIQEPSVMSDILSIRALALEQQTMYLTKGDYLENYLKLFKILEKNFHLYSYFFRIIKVIPINSANGKVFIMRVKNLFRQKISDMDVLVKVPLINAQDSLSYEYYIGMTLNRLRVENKTNHFSLIYGKVNCGFDVTNIDSNRTEEELINVKMCDDKYPEKFHIVYEYIRNINTKRVTSLDEYIRRLERVQNAEEMYILERNIINILMILMYTLQVAQDNMKFTHYDLHLGNVLIVELDEPEEIKIKYGGENILIITSVMPHIIDYGRCYVDPNQVKAEQDNTFKDVDSNNTFTNFSDYQEFLFGEEWLSNSKETCELLDDQLTIWIYNYIHKKILFKDSFGKLYYKRDDKRVYKLNDETTLRFKKMIIDNIYNRHTPKDNELNFIEKIRNDESSVKIRRYHVGIRSNHFNSKYDFFKLMMIVLSQIWKILKKKSDLSKYIDCWINLEDQLIKEYPFYDPKYFSLPCEYHITDYFPNVKMGEWGYWLKNPSDIGKVLYEWIKDDIIQMPLRHIAITHHIGGAVFMPMKRKASKDKLNLMKKVKSYNKELGMEDQFKVDKTSSSDDFVETSDIGNVYYKYVESDLMKKIKKNQVISNMIRLIEPVVNRSIPKSGNIKDI